MLNQFIKNRLTQYYSQTDTAKFITLLLGLHAYLYEGGKWRPSIVESYKFMVLTVNSQETLMKEINDWQKKMIDLGFEPKPLVIAFGKDFEELEDQFLVYFNGFSYKFNSVLRAVEVLLNMFVCFNISYPAPNKNVFQFLMAKIYDKNDDINVNVKTLMKFF